MGIGIMAATSKTAVVTGASSAFGSAYARRFAERGYDLILVGRNEERIKTVAADIAERSGVDVEILIADLADAAELAKVEQPAAYGRVDRGAGQQCGRGEVRAGRGFRRDDLETQVALNITARPGSRRLC